MIKPALQSIVEEELQIFERVRQGVRAVALAGRPDAQSLITDMNKLRDDANTANTRDLPSFLEQLHVQQSLAAQKQKQVVQLPDMRAPYFAHMRLLENGRQKDVLIGHQTFTEIEGQMSIIDWRHAPVAQIFFNFAEGDEYEVELPARVAKGTVVARRLIHFEMGKLIGIKSVDFNLVRHGEEEWREEAVQSGPVFSGGEGSATRQFTLGTGQTHRRPTEIASLLDAHQYRLLQEDPDRPLLILGGAGSGKTTVALHRLAALFFKDPRRFPQHKLLVIVPEPGLVRLSRKLLNGLGMSKVQLSTFDEWVAKQGRYLLGSLPKKLCEDTPAKVIRFKRHPAVCKLFPELAQRRLALIEKDIEKHLPSARTILPQLRTLEARNLRDRVKKFAVLLKQHLSGQESLADQLDHYLRSADDFFRKVETSLQELNSERLFLFSDTDAIESIIKHANGDLEASLVKDLQNHARKQFGYTQQHNLVSADSEYAVGADNRGMDEDDDAYTDTIDVEDFPILMELLHFYTGGFQTSTGSMHTYEHIVLDEAQELSGTELSLVGHALTKDGNVSIAGDILQQTDTTATSLSWEDVLTYLGVEQVASETLKTSYRCPAPIMNFAYDILGPLAPAERPVAMREGADVRIDRFSSEGEAASVYLEELEDLLRRERHASIAIVTCDFDGAERIYQDLKQIPEVRLVRDGEFSFKPGIDIADVTQVKGLEFDYVIIPDATAYHYPATPEARRHLHVAATRAIYQLWVISTSTSSPLIETSSR